MPLLVGEAEPTSGFRAKPELVSRRRRGGHWLDKGVPKGPGVAEARMGRGRREWPAIATGLLVVLSGL